MEKKELSFIEKFTAAGIELKKAIVKSNKEAMIMIASSELNNGLCVSVSVEGKLHDLGVLLASVAIKNKDLKTILMDAIMAVEAYEQ